jgi:hypothetical protein
MPGPTVQREAAKRRTEALVDVIREIGVAGSLRDIAAAQNDRGVATPQGAKWHSTSVGQLLERAKITPALDVLLGDCHDVLATLAARSIQTVVTSPPYWQARSYDHKLQIGLEDTPDAYVAELVNVFRQVRRALRDDGTA